MKAKELIKLGVPSGKPVEAAIKAIAEASKDGAFDFDIEKAITAVVASPEEYRGHKYLGNVAEALLSYQANDACRTEPVPYKSYGQDLEQSSIEQMEKACRLPISVMGALMPDAHTGYGLPIGGVLATENAVIPYAVGVDIACRMKLSVFNLPVSTFESGPEALINALNRETAFGVGASFKKRREHRLMDEDWNITRITARIKDKAWSQLGTSGTGNHFVEFGVLTVEDKGLGLEKGEYLALLSHSGSRGAGSDVASHYSNVAKVLHPELPKEYSHLSWLGLETGEGQEYWHAMELMGRYAAANHEIIHNYIARSIKAHVVLDIENHHNFAWKENHFGKDVIVHRKGATPAAKGAMGIIPGSMATPGFVVRGKGEPVSLNSASHGAGRLVSRTKAKETFKWEEARKLLTERRVTLLSGGLDEVPMAYKDIDQVMAAQADLVDVLARFMPRIVKMAPGNERAED
jgi:tRNA-splicing ligase RtcB